MAACGRTSRLSWWPRESLSRGLNARAIESAAGRSRRVKNGSERIGRLSMMHALGGEGEGEADAAGADAADARVAGAGVGVAGVAVADAVRAVCAPAATGDEDNCSRGRDRCHAGHEHDGRPLCKWTRRIRRTRPGRSQREHRA